MSWHPGIRRESRRVDGRGFGLAPAASILAVVMILASGGCSKHDEKSSQKAPGPIEVTTVKVSPKDTPVTFEYVARVESSRQVSIRARVSGFLDRRVYTEGAVVKAGRTLFLMDPKPFKAQLD